MRTLRKRTNLLTKDMSFVGVHTKYMYSIPSKEDNFSTKDKWAGGSQWRFYCMFRVSSKGGAHAGEASPRGLGNMKIQIPHSSGCRPSIQSPYLSGLVTKAPYSGGKTSSKRVTFPHQFPHPIP